ncbi:FadR/GntR family transcriptional regulator [Sandaracinobacteroides saxicola]|uniref:FadR family transcriptional regulator n=1 Tax=Sandaracinobacteroides saxicola TaxID=2759707 RepID=A0A7G5IM23_9SPHN|nr:FCD domain-containing protein [Sandaracinobacteroides saxicola]QMW24415.1 FadR family transcriptional regulator [Sandaracinobacteroides saxicola]
MTQQRESATWRLMRTLGHDIVRGVHPPDRPFPIEQALSERHALSRSVIREAVKILAAKGLVTSRPRIGIRVRPRTEWNLLDPDVLDWIAASRDPTFLLELLQMRRAVEPEAAALAAGLRDARLIDAIGAAYRRMAAAADGGDDPLESDVAFHCALLNASGNRLFAQLGNLVRTALGSAIHETNRAAGVRVGDLAEHEAILVAVRAGDAAGARTATRAMIDRTIGLIRPDSAG